VARSDRRRPGRGRRLFLCGPVVLVVALFAGAAAAYHFDLGTRWFGAAPRTQAPSPVKTLQLPPVPSPSLVARPAPSGRPAADAVRRALAAGLRDPHLADLRAVVAPLTGRPVLDVGHGRSTPASTLKLLTTTAALEVLGPDHTFATRAVSQGRGAVTLVGGGDPFLAGDQPGKGPAAHDASLQSLARMTAQRLLARGTHAVHVGYDASLFTGPPVNPHWPGAYIPDAVVSPITALWADEGVAADGHGRVAHPAATAAGDFAAYLGKDGIRVRGPVRERPASGAGHELARVTSVPLADIVERVLRNSDNEGAEVLARQVGLSVAGDGSFAGGVTAVRRTLTGLGVDLHHDTLYDGSGLSRDDRLDAASLVQVLQLASSPDHPELRAVVTGLPVAGFDGSLQDRFDHASGRGWVRAKTGTLSGTSALAGLVTDARGRPLVFAFVGNHIPVDGTLDARAALDRLASALADCRC
jgi:serine-type D-Ala-D-Ala carboxypeptidase/endopeptidase (penicillin-binding protein 4)